MGLRVRRTLRLAPGIRGNLSKTGASLSLARRGATLNFSGRGTKATIGLPGTGLRYSEMLHAEPPTGHCHINAFYCAILTRRRESQSLISMM